MTTSAAQQPASSTVWVSNLPYHVDEGDVLAFARQMGLCPERCMMPVDRETGRSRGYCFLQMSSPADAADALTILGGAELDGRQLRADLAKPRPEGRPR